MYWYIYLFIIDYCFNLSAVFSSIFILYKEWLQSLSQGEEYSTLELSAPNHLWSWSSDLARDKDLELSGDPGLGRLPNW